MAAALHGVHRLESWELVLLPVVESYNESLTLQTRYPLSN